MNNKFDLIKNDVKNLEQPDRDTLIQQLINQNLQDVQKRVEKLETDHNKMNEDVEQVKEDVNNKITLDHGEQSALQYIKKRRVEELWKMGGEFQNLIDTKRKLHGRAWSDLYRTFGVSSYRDVKSKDFEEAKKFVESWRPRLF